MLKWKKEGLIYKPSGRHFWNKSHASVPTVYKLNDGRLRVYFASRDADNHCHVGFIDVSAKDPSHILYEHGTPALSPGKPGMFDDCGVMPSHAIDVDGDIWMYYLGWNVRNTIAYHNSIGLAISKDGGITFEKFSEGPLFDRNYIEPYYSATPFVLREGALWRMWYLSNTEWVTFKGKSEPRYHIKYAESRNGIDWQRQGQVAIDYKDDNEFGIVRPCVVYDGHLYRMWYSYRNIQDYRIDTRNSYRIGYAESVNAMDWHRKDEQAGIDVSDEGWDSQMIEYPFVYDHGGKRHMMYNGNTFGASGFGYATLTEKA